MYVHKEFFHPIDLTLKLEGFLCCNLYDGISKVENGLKLESGVFERQIEGKLQHELMERGNCTHELFLLFPLQLFQLKLKAIWVLT